MSYQVQIGTEVITLPSTGADAVWSGGQIRFNQAVAGVLNNLASPYDIVNTQLPVGQTEGALTLGSFQSGEVRSFNFTYGIYRKSSTETLYEEGTVNGVYRDDTNVWVIDHVFSGPRRTSTGQEGTPYHLFTMSGDNIVLQAFAPSGSYEEGQICYSASTELVNP